MGERRFWTDAERAIVQRWYRKLGAVRTARKLKGRTQKAVWQQSRFLGLAKRNARRGEPWERMLRAKHAQGWTDFEIARVLRWGRETVGEWRRRLGLGSNRMSERYRRRVAKNTRCQCRKAGVRSLADVRKLAYQQRARASGWPEDLTMRAVQILDLLHARGPMVRREIAAAIGLPWRGSRKSLCGNGPGGSYLAELMRRGLVVSLGRNWTGGSGNFETVYSLALSAVKGAIG